MAVHAALPRLDRAQLRPDSAAGRPRADAGARRRRRAELPDRGRGDDGGGVDGALRRAALGTRAPGLDVRAGVRHLDRHVDHGLAAGLHDDLPRPAHGPRRSQDTVRSRPAAADALLRPLPGRPPGDAAHERSGAPGRDVLGGCHRDGGRRVRHGRHPHHAVRDRPAAGTGGAGPGAGPGHRGGDLPLQGTRGLPGGPGQDRAAQRSPAGDDLRHEGGPVVRPRTAQLRGLQSGERPLTGIPGCARSATTRCCSRPSIWRRT